MYLSYDSMPNEIPVAMNAIGTFVHSKEANRLIIKSSTFHVVKSMGTCYNKSNYLERKWMGSRLIIIKIKSLICISATRLFAVVGNEDYCNVAASGSASITLISPQIHRETSLLFT